MNVGEVPHAPEGMAVGGTRNDRAMKLSLLNRFTSHIAA